VVKGEGERYGIYLAALDPTGGRAIARRKASLAKFA
jgi:hypothetical protein